MEPRETFPQGMMPGKRPPLNYCPRCGVEANGANYCGNCGRDLAGKTLSAPATVVVEPPTPAAPKRPWGIAIVCVLWFFGGLANVFGGLTGLSDDLYALAMLESLPSGVRLWAGWAVPLETLLVTATVILGLMQFATIYGLWNRRPWARKTGIGSVMSLVAVNWIEAFLLMTAPPSLGVQPDFTMTVISTVMAAVYISYLSTTHVKTYVGGE